MKSLAKKFFNLFGLEVSRLNDRHNFYKSLYEKFQPQTMLEKDRFIGNLKLCELAKHLEGDFVECGVWKGGMSGGMASVLGKHVRFHLFDSFEGLPPAKEIDGKAALQWQQDITSPAYYNNCTSSVEDVHASMVLAQHSNYEIYKGWFDNTLRNIKTDKISILRLDGDWYDSIMVCLEELYPRVVPNGIVILDDYPYWEGCSKAIHDYLSKIKSASHIQEIVPSVPFLIKKD